jgi:hypothetical protein
VNEYRGKGEERRTIVKCLSDDLFTVTVCEEVDGPCWDDADEGWDEACKRTGGVRESWKNCNRRRTHL